MVERIAKASKVPKCHGRRSFYFGEQKAGRAQYSSCRCSRKLDIQLRNIRRNNLPAIEVSCISHIMGRRSKLGIVAWRKRTHKLRKKYFWWRALTALSLI